MNEIWDAYDENGNKLDGIVLEKHKPIPKKMYHLVSDILVQHQDGTFLITQRDKNKKFGGLWEVSAGGAAQAGENALQCACRELQEETGIVAEQLEFLGYCVKKEVQSIFAEFRLITNMEKDNVVLHEGETMAYRWVDKKELYTMAKNGLLTKRMQSYLQQILNT